MKRVKGNANGQKNIEMRWLVDDTDAREQPLKILEQKVPIFEEPEHAQVHADAANQPDASRTASFSRGNSSAEPKIHCRRGKEQRGKWWVPCAIKNVTCDHEEIFPRLQERMLQYTLTTTAKKTTNVSELKSMAGARLLI